ncbi:MAG: response regulator transcription factor [Chloroflexi bacterium]|nr:response regulator transcription factor [Chloroflexota bacterium]
MFRAILVDDQPIFRDIIRGVLQRTGRFQFIGEAADGADAIDLYNRVMPDVVIMDVQMPNMSGFEATVRILEQHPEAVIILTSMQSEGGFARVAVESGARGFVPKRHLDADSILSLLDEQPDQDYMAA